MLNSEGKDEPDNRCSNCGYKWNGRVAEPKSCPRCKARRDYIWSEKL